MHIDHTKQPGQPIDFLPQHYREEYERRRSQAWRILFVVVFAATLPTASLYQYRLKLSVQKELGRIAQQHGESQADAARLATLETEMAERTATANLITYLRHRWPTTQILAAVTQPLPQTMVLEEIAISRQQAETQATPTLNLSNEQSEAATSAGPAAIEDVRTLAKKSGSEIIVRLTGLTSNSLHLHRYLAELARHPLFVQTELESVESEPGGNGETTADRFELHLVVRPSYGAPDGPTGNNTVAQDAGGVADGDNPS
jgi:hypothetical protein